MTFKLKKLNMDVVENGITVDLGDDSSITLRSTLSKKYKDYVQQRIAPYTTQIKRKSIDDKVLGKIFEGITNDALADVVILDWAGIKDENGNDILYSKEKAHELITDPAYIEFKDLVTDLSESKATFQEVVEGVVKN